MSEISRMATNDWKNLASAQKDKFIKEAADEHASRELTADEKERKVEEYNEKVKRIQD